MKQTIINLLLYKGTVSVCVCVCPSRVSVYTVHLIDFKLGMIVEEHPRSVLSIFSIYLNDVIGHLRKLNWLSWA